MKSSTRLVIVGLAAALVGAVIGGAGVYATQRARIAALEAQSGRITQLENRLDEKDVMIESLAEKYNQLQATSSAESTPAAAATQHGTTKPAAKTQRQFAYIRSINVAGRTLVADYAQYLSGDEAAKAAADAGDESPPPNDYYIVNGNPKLRELNISPNVTVRLTTKPGESAVAGGYKSSLEDLAGYLETDSEETIAIRVDGYWLTLVNGVVTGIEEQYQP